MKKLYKAELKRTTYQGQSSIETRELWADSPSTINTYRLGGFQRDNIEVLSAEYIRDIEPIEVELDLERNEVMVSVSIDHFLNETLSHARDFEQQVMELSEQSDIDFEEAIEQLGYEEVVHDNTYNYSSDLSNDLDFKVYIPEGSDKDYIYNKDAIVFVREHIGLDVRAGYKFKGIYKPGDYDGLCNFLDIHVRVTIFDCNNNGVRDFDGDGALYQALREYKLSEKSTPDNIIVTKDNEEYTLSLYSPAYGV